MKEPDIRISENPLRAEEAIDHVSSNDAGGICVFIGTVRDATKGKTVVRLEFEGYRPMAISEMRKIALSAMEQWPVLGVAIYHRLGALEIAEVPVVIAVSAAHRQAAFEACQFCIDTLKKTVPIWKKEIFQDGEAWVSAHP